MKTTKAKKTADCSLGQTAQGDPQYEAIYLGADLHKNSISVTRIIDHGTPQPAQRFSWPLFYAFVEKQIPLAKKVYVVYEAGAFGFSPARKMKELGVECLVVHPEKLDPHHKRVQTDKLDSRHLADKLQRYVLGNKKAMVVVYIPTPAEENLRMETRHRCHLKKQIKSLIARGGGLLLSQGVFATKGWWQDKHWASLQGKISSELMAALTDDRLLIQTYQERLAAVEKRLHDSAPQQLPKGFGALTFVLILRELCNFKRFHNRRNIGGFTGLCGGVSSSGSYHADLSINKAGNPYLRTLLIELAWRIVYWQPHYTGLKVWNRFCRGSGGVHVRYRKKAIVALARQLAVDLWRWQTGLVTLKDLGLQAA